MTPLMQRILHGDAPAQVALALLQSMQMNEAILYHGVGLDEGEGGRRDQVACPGSSSIWTK